MRRRSAAPPPPLWFAIAVALAVACVWRALGAPVTTPGAPAPPALAFWGFVIGLLGLLWDGAQAAYEAIIIALQWSIKALWAFAIETYNAFIAFGKIIRSGIQDLWHALPKLYDDVLKPAWDKFWKLFDKLKTWLNDTFGPVFRFLYKVRDEILCFYKHWVRPVLDVIEGVRSILRVLEALHLKFAQALDDWLGQLEHYLNYPFQKVLEALNGVINLVNRIVTIDGLLQRVVLVRSVQRDVGNIARVFANARKRDLTELEVAQQGRFGAVMTQADLNTNITAWWNGEHNDVGDVLDVLVANYVALWSTDTTSASG